MEGQTAVDTTPWIHSFYGATRVGNHLDLNSSPVLVPDIRGPRAPLSEGLIMDPRGGMSYHNYKQQMAQQRGHQAMRSVPQGSRAPALVSQQVLRASTKNASRPQPQTSHRPSPHTSSRPSPQSSSRPSPHSRPSPQSKPSPQSGSRTSQQSGIRHSPMSSSRPSPQSSSRPSPQTASRPSPHASSRHPPPTMRAGKPSSQTSVRRSAASASGQSPSTSRVMSHTPAAHGGSRPSAHVQSSLHSHMQRQTQAGQLQRQPGPLAFSQNTRSELFHFHSPPSTHSMASHEKHPIPSRSSASVGEMPLDLSRQAPMSSTISSQKGTSKASTSSLDSPLDLSGKGNSPINLGKKTTTAGLINVQKCSFCNASFSTVPFLKMHLGKCPRKPKNLTNIDIDRWIENNFPDAIPSSSRTTTEPLEKSSEDIRDNLPRVNGAVALGTICIKEEPTEEDISIIDIEPIGKSVDKSMYKGSAKKTSSNTSTKPATTSSGETPQSPPTGYIKYACIYCDKTYDKKEVLQEHIKSHSTVNITTNNSQSASRPVLTQVKQKSPLSESERADKKNDNKQTSVLTSPPHSTQSKSPELQGTEKRSSTPTKSTEKKLGKRQTGNIKSIADNLLRRMTEKTQHTEKPDAVAAEATSNTPPPAEDKTIQETTAEEKEEAPVKEVAVKRTEKQSEKETEPPASKTEDKDQTEPTTEEKEPEKESPKKSSAKKKSPVKSSKVTKKSPEKAKSKGKATPKSQKKVEKETKKVEEPVKASNKKDVRNTRESRRDKAQVTVEVPSEGKKTREATKKAEVDKENPERIESPTRSAKTAVKEAQDKVSERKAKSNTEKQARSPTRKAPKGEKMTREKAADIARLALDMGCLRRSPRAGKAGSGLPSPTQPVAEVTEVNAPPIKKTKGGKSAEKIDETRTSPVKKATKRGSDEIPAPTPPPSKRRKQEEPEEPEEKEEEEMEVEEPKVKEKTNHKKGKKGGKKGVEKTKKPVDINKEGDTQGIEKFLGKKSKLSKSGKTTSEAPKEKSVKDLSKETEKEEDIGKKTLQDVEMEAVEELIKLSRGEGVDRLPKPKDSPTQSSPEVETRHVAAAKGKVTKKGRKKKNKHRTRNEDESGKMPRIVGRKAYKEWLESHATNVTDSSEEIVKKKSQASVSEAKSVKEKKKKKYEDDEDYVVGVQEAGDMDVISEYGDDEEKEDNDQTWESGSKSNQGNEDLNLQCSKCKGRVTGRKDFNKHILCNNPTNETPTGEPSLLSCPVCAQEFRNKNRCWGHMVRVHAGIKSFHECPYCFKKYCRRDAVQVHVASVHPKERRRELAEKNGWQPKEEEEEEEFKDEDVDVDLTCKRCNRPIQNKADCYTHILLHSPRGKRKVCPLCDKTSKDSSRVWEHVMVEHAGIKPFGCDQCAFRCAHEENLKKHIQTYHGKFLDPVARVKMDFESENWDLGLNPSYLQEPQGPLPLSSGNVISLIDLSLNVLIINQRTKVMNLNLLLSGHNMDLRSIINEALQNGVAGSKEAAAASTSQKEKEGKSEKEDNNNNGGEEDDLEEGIYPDEPAVIASRAMIPNDCAGMELPCVLCPMGVKGADEFKLHVLKHICDSTRVCPVCRRAFSRKSSCRRHLVEHTFKWRHKCTLCSQTFPKAQYLEKHYPKHLEQGFQCLNCLSKFESEEELWRHIHPNRPLSLKDTPLGVADTVKFSCRRVHVCEKCHQEFRSAWGLQYHRENTHSEGTIEEEKPYMCLTCGKRFKSNITLRNHQEIHMEDCSYLCRHCHLTCRTKRQLQKHIEYKHMEKIYKCSYCPKMFATRSRLKEHAIMHQNKTFICDICGKVYRHQRVFETHCRQHVKPPVKKHRLFPCPQCNHQSKSKEQLNLHMRRHTGERPYKCKECPKAFSSQTGLWRHQMSHAGRKPHECHLCKKTFVQKCSLDRHLLSHAGIKPYRCEYCGAEYSQSYPLTKHMEKKHPGMPFIIIKKDVDPVVIDPSQQQAQQQPDEAVAEVAAEAAKRATAEAMNSLPGVAPAGNEAQRVTATENEDSEEKQKEFLSV